MESGLSASPGDIKRVAIGGKRYFYHFITPTSGKAFVRNKNDSEGAYAGFFSLVPISKIYPEIPESAVTANTKVPEKSNTPKKEVIVPAPTPAPAPKKEDKTPIVPPKQNNTKKNVKPTTTKKTATAKPPPLPVKPSVTAVTPTPQQPVSTYTGYFQSQEGLGCGRHALNNLLGRQAFVKGKTTDVIPTPPVEPISMLGVCSLLKEVLKKKGLRESCLATENYDVNTMNAAMNTLGYKTEDYLPNDMLDESGDFLGFLVNLGVVSGKPKHWIALKRKGMGDDGVARYDYFDSLNSGPKENITYSDFARQHPQVYIIKVLLPKGGPVKIEDKFSQLLNVAALSTYPTDCSILYDPCTREPLSSMQELEVRVAGIKAAQNAAAAAKAATETETKKGGGRKKGKKAGRKTRKGRRT